MKRIVAIFLVSCVCSKIFAQTMETTLYVTSNNKARIVVRAMGSSITGNSSNFVFSVAIPSANSSATMTVTNLDATRLPSSLTTISSYTDASYKYFNLTYSGTNSNSVTWNQGTPYELIELDFNGSSNGTVSLVSLPDGNLSAPAVPGNWFNYIEVGGIGYSDPASLFYQSSYTGVPTQAMDYSNGIAMITTNDNVSLPVSMLNFSGYKSGGKNILNWTIANEINNKGFEILKSGDGMNYSSIGFVNSLVGGNTNSEVQYSFNDNNPVGRKQYYRLNQIDLDGRSKQSNIVMITRETPASLTIWGLFPNPAYEQVNLVIETPQRDRVIVVVADIVGKIVKQQVENVEIGSNTVLLDIARLSKGSYLVKLVCQSSDCQTATAKFNKQ